MELSERACSWNETKNKQNEAQEGQQKGARKREEK